MPVHHAIHRIGQKETEKSAVDYNLEIREWLQKKRVRIH